MYDHGGTCALAIALLLPALFPTALQAAPESAASSALVYDSELQLYCPTRQACGVVASYVALHRLGIPTPVELIASELPVWKDSKYGTSMADLKRFLVSRGADAEAIEISATNLVKAVNDCRDCTAIAWMDKNHWVAVEGNTSSSARYFDYPDWHAVTDDDFVSRFSGKALFIRSHDSLFVLRANSLLSWIPSACAVLSCGIWAWLLLSKRRQQSQVHRAAG